MTVAMASQRLGDGRQVRGHPRCTRPPGETPAAPGAGTAARAGHGRRDGRTPGGGAARADCSRAAPPVGGRARSAPGPPITGYPSTTWRSYSPASSRRRPGAGSSSPPRTSGWSIRPRPTRPSPLPTPAGRRSLDKSISRALSSAPAARTTRRAATFNPNSVGARDLHRLDRAARLPVEHQAGHCRIGADRHPGARQLRRELLGDRSRGPEAEEARLHRPAERPATTGVPLGDGGVVLDGPEAEHVVGVPVAGVELGEREGPLRAPGMADRGGGLAQWQVAGTTPRPPQGRRPTHSPSRRVAADGSARAAGRRRAGARRRGPSANRCRTGSGSRLPDSSSRTRIPDPAASSAVVMPATPRHPPRTDRPETRRVPDHRPLSS